MFTPRERAVARYIQDGLCNKEIAAALSITERGVKFHVSQLLQKTGAENRVRLARMLMQNNPGMLLPSDCEDDQELRGKLTTLKQRRQSLKRQQKLVDTMITACEAYLSHGVRRGALPLQPRRTELPPVRPLLRRPFASVPPGSHEKTALRVVARGHGAPA